MATLSERWITEGATWETILNKIESTVQKYARKHATEAKRDRWDVPGFHYQWKTEASALEHLIQVLVVGAMGAYELDFGGTAWKDDPASRRRKWRSHGEQRVQVPQYPDTLDLRTVDTRLKALDKTLSGWSEADLTKENDLPPRPEHLKDAFPDFEAP